jgi:hypothetical protein
MSETAARLAILYERREQTGPDAALDGLIAKLEHRPTVGDSGEELLAADGGRVRKLSGRDLWIARLTAGMDADRDPEDEEQTGTDSALTGYDAFKHHLETAFERVQPKPEDSKARRARHIRRLRAVNRKRREKGENVIAGKNAIP